MWSQEFLSGVHAYATPDAPQGLSGSGLFPAEFAQGERSAGTFETAQNGTALNEYHSEPNLSDFVDSTTYPTDDLEALFEEHTQTPDHSAISPPEVQDNGPEPEGPQMSYLEEIDIITGTASGTYWGTPDWPTNASPSGDSATSSGLGPDTPSDTFEELATGKAEGWAETGLSQEFGELGFIYTPENATTSPWYLHGPGGH
jgi:hypothetical protein